MSKYIDAEKLISEILKLRSESCISESDDYYEYAKSEIINIIESIQQKPAEWSEEDEDAIQQAILALEDRYDEYEPNLHFLGYKLPFNKAAERLKSLRPSWKPSEEQMNALADATMRDVFPDGYRECLETLYEQLKNL